MMNVSDKRRHHPTSASRDPIYHLAWAKFKDEVGSKDIPGAISLLRQLERDSPEFARFNIAKMKYLSGDESAKDDIQMDCEAGFGPALYLMGMYSRKFGGDTGLIAAIQYFHRAAQNGHLPFKMLLWRFSNVGFWQRMITAAPAYVAALKFVLISLRDEDDIRIWT